MNSDFLKFISLIGFLLLPGCLGVGSFTASPPIASVTQEPASAIDGEFAPASEAAPQEQSLVVAGKWPISTTGAPNPSVDVGFGTKHFAIEGDTRVICKDEPTGTERISIQGYLKWKDSMDFNPEDWAYLGRDMVLSFYDLKTNSHVESNSEIKSDIFGYVDVTVEVSRGSKLALFEVNPRQLMEQPAQHSIADLVRIPHNFCPPAFTPDSDCDFIGWLTFTRVEPNISFEEFNAPACKDLESISFKPEMKP